MATSVYRYGLHAPHEGADVVRAQMQASHEYRNTLVEIERGRRAAVRAVARQFGIDALERAAEAADHLLAEAEVAVAKHRARSRERDEPSELREALRVAREGRREAVRALRSRMAELRSICRACRESGEPDPCAHSTTEARAMRDALDAIGERARELAKNAYRYSGCFHGQRALVDDAAGDSFVSLALYDQDGKPNDPRFVRWRGDGAVGLQIQGGLSVDQVHGCTDTRLRLRAPDARAWSGRCADRRRYGSTAELRLRVGSDGRDPVWAAWICDMDRPLPEGARVVWATVHLRQRGPWSEWSVSLTLQVPDPMPLPARAKGAVAVDVGWRVEGDELRVAAWRDEHGQSGVLRLPAAWLSLMASSKMHRARQDDLFNGARLGLAWWLATGAEVPEGFRAEVGEMPRWRSPGRLFSFWSYWRDHRFEGDGAAFDLLSGWRWRNQQEWSAQEKNRLQALRRRQDLYRVFAAKLADSYDTVVIEQFDLREVARRERFAEESENEVARGNRQLAAVSELRVCIRQAAAKRGRLVVAMPAQDTTRTCPSCGLVQDRKAQDSIVLVCECGHRWDQDRDGAAPVLLAAWRERPGDAKVLVSARTPEKSGNHEALKESRWQRAARLRKEKEARMERAREGARNVAK